MQQRSMTHSIDTTQQEPRQEQVHTARGRQRARGIQRTKKRLGRNAQPKQKTATQQRARETPTWLPPAGAGAALAARGEPAAAAAAIRDAPREASSLAIDEIVILLTLSRDAY